MHCYDVNILTLFLFLCALFIGYSKGIYDERKHYQTFLKTLSLFNTENRSLVEKKNQIVNNEKSKLQKFCTLAAKYIPITEWPGTKEDPKPWGCILDKESDMGYCDNCPVRKICPNESKHWSK